MRVGIPLVGLVVLLVTAVHCSDDTKLFRKFLVGLTAGIGLPVSYNYLQDNNIGSSDINITLVFNSIKALAYYNFTKIGNSTQNLTTIADQLSNLQKKRKAAVEANANLSETLNLTISTFRDGATFLRSVHNNLLDDSLRLVGNVTPEYISYVGEELGLILNDTYGTTASVFLEGLASGLLLDINTQNLVNNNVDNSTINMTSITNVLALLKKNPFGLIPTVQLALIETGRELLYLPVTHSATINKDANLSLIYNEILPTIYRDVRVTIKTIQSLSLVDRFDQVGTNSPDNIGMSAAYIGFVFRNVYPKLKTIYSNESL
eukprot:TRINITY_DN372_c0_g1_i4.p1 TRINITY_DN372_c0_g1~~TRINITY_DN372_c0_g1_i4.p1  ORF type:complete len:319 (+),score=70.06 TRINITY_DN372_c0_g1_i4:151-1107(+)